jgi:hypothetical protein
MTATTTTATTDGALLPTNSMIFHNPTILTFPRMAHGLLPAPQQYPVCFLPHPVYYAAPTFQLPSHPLPFLAQQYSPTIVRPPVVIGIARKRKPQVEYHCCKKYWKYHVLDKPVGKMGALPHALDCPVRKQCRRPNNRPKGPH